ncbi:phosphopantetheine-binding protein, partial [Streptomyces sp. NPDC059715]|uniref:phosphopantetheine-binding protein n=1 Tax=Streptomyces sp. NPDC059715 TaxID=3346921 RepID=UPI00367C236F
EYRLGDVREFMIGVWSELLGRSDLTEHSDFFARGGDTLLITRLVRRIDRELGVTLPVRDMLAAPTLGEQTLLLSDAVAGSRRSVFTSGRQSD